MTGQSSPLLRIPQEHRRLDELLGRLLAAIEGGSAAAAREAIMAFDEALRRHTAIEEEELFPRLPEGKLLPRESETESERLFRELALEHVQIRELSGMLVRLLTEKEDLHSARALLPNLLRRWDAHCAKEEGEALAQRGASDSFSDPLGNPSIRR